MTPGIATAHHRPRRHVRSRPQAQAHRAGHPRADHAAVRVLRRRLLLPRRAACRSVATVGGDKITAAGIRRRCCASSSSGCARRSAAISTRRCSKRPKCATRCSTSSSTSGCSSSGRARTGSASATRSCSSSSPDCRRSRRTASSRPDKYRQVLAAQNMSPLMFEQRVRGELVLSPLQDPIVERQHRRADVGAALSRAARAEARGRRRADRRRAVREVGEGQRRRRQGVLRQEPDGVPDARGREDRVPAAERRTRSRRRSRSSPAEAEAGVRREREAVHDERGAAGVAHPDRGEARRERRRQGGGEEEGDGAARRRRARSRDAFAELAKANSQDTGLGGAGRRPRLVRARRDGEAVRGCGVRGEGRRHRRAGADRTSATT